MKKYLLLKLSAIFFALFSGFISLAQEKDTLTNSVLQLGLDKMELQNKEQSLLVQTTSTASKTEEKTSEAAAIMQIVDRREIMAFGGNTLGDVLNRLTNFYLASPTHLFNNVTSLRGDLPRNYSSHVLLLLNGRPFRESLFGGIDMAFVNAVAIDDIERIEIIRGAGSVLYGSGAFTGVINIIIQNTKETETTLSMRAGAIGTRGIIFTQSYNRENFILHASARYYGQQGGDATYFDRDSVKRTMNGANENFSMYVSAETKKISARIYYGGVNANLMNNETKWSRNFGNHDRTISRRGFIDLGFRHSFSKNWNMTINNTSNTHNIDFSFFDDNKARFNTFDNLTEITHFIRLVKNMNIIVGGLLNLNKSNSDGSLDENFEPVVLFDAHELEKNYAFYAQADYRLFKYFKLNSGMQINKTAHDDFDFSPRLGATMHLPFGLGAKILYAEAFRTAAHLDIDYQNSEFINPENLRAENVHTTDLQLFYEKPKIYVALTYYNSNQIDIIKKKIIKDEIYTYVNQATINFQGIEVEGKFSPSPKLLLTGNFSYYYSKTNENEAYTSAVPAITTCAGIAYLSKNKALNLGLYNVYFSKPPDVKNSQTQDREEDQRKLLNPIPQAFDMISMNLSLDIATAFHIKNLPKTIVTLYGENLLGTEVWQPEYFRRNINSVPYQGIGTRAFYLTLGVKF